MADVNRGKRPLSPFMLGTYYRLQITSVLSLLHRMTGVGLALGAVLVVWWLIAAAVSAEYFALVDRLLTSWLGIAVLTGCLWALWYHGLNGVRHLIWDAGSGFELRSVSISGWIVVIGSVLLTILTILVI